MVVSARLETIPVDTTLAVEMMPARSPMRSRLYHDSCTAKLEARLCTKHRIGVNFT
jgi:hypothetical protein